MPPHYPPQHSGPSERGAARQELAGKIRGSPSTARSMVLPHPCESSLDAPACTASSLTLPRTPHGIDLRALGGAGAEDNRGRRRENSAWPKFRPSLGQGLEACSLEWPPRPFLRPMVNWSFVVWSRTCSARGGRSSDPRHRFCGDYHKFLLGLGVSEAERKMERGTNTGHVRSTQPSNHRTDSSSRHGLNVVEIDRAVSRQAVCLRGRDLCWKLTDSHAIRSSVSVYPVCCAYSCATTSMDGSIGRAGRTLNASSRLL